MQQLIPRPVQGLCLLDEQSSIVLDVQDKVSWEDFADFAQRFCTQFDCQHIALSRGADRGQLHFRTELGDFILHYECLLDSSWIEAFSSDNKEHLVELYHWFLSTLQH